MEYVGMHWFAQFFENNILQGNVRRDIFSCRV